MHMRNMQLCLVTDITARQSLQVVHALPHTHTIGSVICSRWLHQRLLLFICGGLTSCCLQWLSDGLGEKIDQYLAEYRVQHPPDLVMLGWMVWCQLLS